MQAPEERTSSLFVVPLFQAFLAVFFFIALLYGFRELILFSGILLGIGIGAYLWTRLSPLGVFCDLTTDRSRIFPHEPFRLNIEITNAKWLPVKVGVTLPSGHESVRLGEGGTGLYASCGLLWYQKCRLERDGVIGRRGVYRLGPPAMVVGDLFGFYKREEQKGASIEMIVYPRVGEIKRVSLPKRDFFGVPGAAGPVEDPVYLYGTRDYQPGRPMRRIHWKASARFNRIQEKLCEPAQREKVLILIETGSFAEAGAEERFERTIENAASHAAWLDRNGHAIGVAANGVMAGARSPFVPPALGPSQLSRILEVLARVTMQPDGDLLDIFSRVRPLPWGLTCLLFSLGPCDATRRIEASLKHRRIATVVQYASKTPSVSAEQASSPSDPPLWNAVRTRRVLGP